MWDSISVVLTSSNAIPVLLAVIIILILVAIFAKVGVLSVKKAGIVVGGGHLLEERLLLKRELEFVQKYCLGLEGELTNIFADLKHDQTLLRVYRFKYLAAMISNEVERWVLINHFSKDPTYLKGKAVELRALIVAEAGKMGICDYDDAALSQAVMKWVAAIVDHVLLLRKGSSIIK